MDSTFVNDYFMLARYNSWMNKKIFAACEALTDAQRKVDRGACFKAIH